jgi:hypothetical protein
MKYLDFWYILFVKINRRVSIERNLNDDYGAYCATTVGLPVVIIPPILMLQFQFPDINIIVPVFAISAFVSIWLVEYRYKRKSRWKIIEDSINSNYSKNERDRIFVILIAIFILSITCTVTMVVIHPNIN